jgi:pullulanase
MPVQDFEHDDFSDNYFWGYMPVNFNSPDGWFATNLFNDSRIREFKKLVDELHKSGIKVVMDVVYNHTAETSPEVLYNFNGFTPSYYYRQKLDGSYWNGSGCGNEVRSENPMVRRFIVESLKYWVEEYKIDGFRFDLMGLIDIETMREIVKTLRSMEPNIFIYGEPWTAGETPIQPTVKGTQRKEGFGVFNDHFRDAIKGPWYNVEPEYVQTGKNVEAIKKGIEGSINDFTDSPLETINYVACHDGLTLWDRLKASTEGSATITEEELKAMDKLCAAIILTSQGVPFIHAGQELLRSKSGSHNSYNQPDEINKIRWKLKEQNNDIFQYYRGLIKLRTEHPIFRMTGVEEIKNNLIFLDSIGIKIPKNCIAYKLKRGSSNDSWGEVLVLFNPNRKSEKFVIPKGKWNMVVNDEISGIETIQVIKGKSVKLNSISAMVLHRE